MTSQKLPERASLEHLRNQAKSLLKAAREGSPEASERFRALGMSEPALHDAQSVIAREYGFRSWKELKQHIEERVLTFAEALNEFLRCATGDAPDRALRLVDLHPGIANANLFAEIVLGDGDAVAARLARDARAAVALGGPQNWEPLLYACHTCLCKDNPERLAGLVRIARALIAHGANPKGEYHWNWHPELPRTALWAALCAVAHLPLAEALLEAGANPNDGVSPHINAGGGNIAVLELLHRYGLNANGIPGAVPPLRYIMNWSRTPKGVQWLLEHGADPNLEFGDAPIHSAAQRWDVPMVELLAKHGADIHRRRADGKTAYTIAALAGNREIADWLLAHGAKDELTPIERYVAEATAGNAPTDTTLRTQLTRVHHLLLQTPAERGDARVLRAMLAAGFDPNVAGEDGFAPLHRAAMAGRVEAVRVLVNGGASVTAIDATFNATPLVCAVEGWRNRSGDEVDHIGVARVLIAAGSPLEWKPPEGAPDPEGTLELLAKLIAAAAIPV